MLDHAAERQGALGPHTTEAETTAPRGLRRTNWSLTTGGLLVLLVAALAIAGPKLAPRDPLEENPVIKIGDQWDARPFAAFTPGFPLGSDTLGRDLLSRLLWGIGPTIVLVAIVAAVRLALGLMIGLAAGWSAGRIGRALDTAIGAALTLPTLIVALAAIAAVGVEIGVLAFVIGLSITGWAETAQVVRDQTRIVKGEDYVESARGLGESGLQIVVRHVRRQVLPLAWMLFAFEVSGALMVTAQLGFLGYYVGGDFWYSAEDYTAYRASGMPELGQLLATSSHSFLEDPWGMFAVGTVVFATILGFNLFGQGMRQRLPLVPAAQLTLYTRTLGRAGAWIEARIMSPLSRRDRTALMGASLALGLVAIGVAGISFMNAQAAAQPQGPVAELVIPGGHLWASELHDAWGSMWAPVSGPGAPASVAWTFEDETGFVGGPAVAADGRLYIAAKGGSLYALDPDGSVVWQAALPARPAGAPALDATGHVYVADERGLSAFTVAGEAMWRFQPEKGIAVSGPVVAPDGTIYYAHGGGFVQAVSPDGQSLWRARAREVAFQTSSPPRLSPDGRWVFLQNGVVHTADGTLPAFKSLPSQFAWFFVGADGRTYLISGHIVSEWQSDGQDEQVVQSARWEFQGGSAWPPLGAGVMRDQTIWLLYGASRAPTQVYWIDPAGRVLSRVKVPQNPSRVIAVDQNKIAYLCSGDSDSRRASCFALQAGVDDPLWQIEFDKGGSIAGGALVPGRMYVAIREGYLYALGDGQK